MQLTFLKEMSHICVCQNDQEFRIHYKFECSFGIDATFVSLLQHYSIYQGLNNTQNNTLDFRYPLYYQFSALLAILHNAESKQI